VYVGCNRAAALLNQLLTVTVHTSGDKEGSMKVVKLRVFCNALLYRNVRLLSGSEFSIRTHLSLRLSKCPESSTVSVPTQDQPLYQQNLLSCHLLDVLSPSASAGAERVPEEALFQQRRSQCLTLHAHGDLFGLRHRQPR
jgi:hypothetical protein